MKQHLLAMLLFLSAYYSTDKVTATTLQDYDVFKKWIRIQRVYKDKDISSMSQQLDETFLARFRKSLEKNFKHLKNTRHFLAKITDNQVTQNGYQITTPLNSCMKEAFSKIYNDLEHNPKNFFAFLQDNHFSTEEINKQELSQHYDATVEKNKALIKLLFPTLLDLQQDEYLFAVGNRIFEYCFNQETFPDYQQLLLSQKEYPLVRCINSILWYLLVGDGWKHWHQKCLANLQQESANGKTINYIAGGNDFYQLLKHGIYNIRIVDPFLPSQDRYYAENWQWLHQGELDDEVLCNFDAKKITLKRAECSQKGTINAKLSTGQIVNLPRTITTWDVYDNENNQPVGKVIMDRRLATQEDFDPNQAVLCSYDEAIYAVAPEMLAGWGINPGQMEDSQNIYIKQLRNPINKDILMNIRTAAMLNYTDVRFINYASDPH